ncbi:hypothetical protein D5R81_12235 [Parashewanella spongiae]|uniref:Uncharacterized protein n=1 Tax=Parashewanella spongiae TaxID=342950 RepID=A0A3A6TMR9_9GAMM|nr:hypothetical protein [Parashewanella spongiae]MCL1079745.1 hypothetical protein [Parashewanella spongiae]RJY12542.1 hypothetical protein D5R81_12235 [Parashewanella spongiae]
MNRADYTTAELLSPYNFLSKTLQYFPEQAVLYLHSESSIFDGYKILKEYYCKLDAAETKQLHLFFCGGQTSASSKSCEHLEHRETGVHVDTSLSFIDKTKNIIQQLNSNQESAKFVGISLSSLIETCTQLSDLIDIIHTVKKDKIARATQWDIRLIHKLLHKVAVFNDLESSKFDNIFNDIISFTVSTPYRAKTCTLLLKLIELNLNFSNAKSLVLGEFPNDSLMKRWGIEPNVIIYNTFITVCGKTNHFDTAWQLVHGNKRLMVPDSPLQANQVTCLNLLTACAKTGHFGKAKALVLGDDSPDGSLMKQWGIEPDVKIFSAFITVCGKTNHFDAAWQLVYGENRLMAPDSPLQANQVTCLNLLKACAETGHFGKAKALVLGNPPYGSLMKQWGVKPNLKIYNAFITVCGKTNHFVDAWQLVQQMMAPGSLLQANQITCLNLLTACAETGYFNEAKTLVLGNASNCSLIKQWGIEPDVKIYGAFITVCGKTNHFDVAWQLVHGKNRLMAPDLPLQADILTCMNLISACVETRNIEKANALVLGDDSPNGSLMKQWGIEPNEKIFNAFITVCGKTDNFDIAWQLVHGVKRLMAPDLPLQPDRITCLNLLTACAETGNFEKANTLMLGNSPDVSLMKQWGIKPDEGILCAFIKVYTKVDKFEVGKVIVKKIMKEYEISVSHKMHAHLAMFDKTNFANTIDSDIKKGVYRESVGLTDNCLDLHINAIFEKEEHNALLQGVPLEFAELLFSYHYKEKKNKVTTIATGYHGGNTLKHGMIKFLKEQFGLEFVGKETNPGQIVLNDPMN